MIINLEGSKNYTYFHVNRSKKLTTLILVKRHFLLLHFIIFLDILRVTRKNGNDTHILLLPCSSRYRLHVLF